MTHYIETPARPELPARAFRIHNGAWEITAAADAGNPRARWYGFTACPPRDVLAQAYMETIGYDPFEDCPSIQPGEVSRTLLEHDALERELRYDSDCEAIALAICETTAGNGRDDWDSHMQNCYAAVANSYLEGISIEDWHASALSLLETPARPELPACAKRHGVQPKLRGFFAVYFDGKFIGSSACPDAAYRIFADHREAAQGVAHDTR